jgi:hypothetical protein
MTPPPTTAELYGYVADQFAFARHLTEAAKLTEPRDDYVEEGGDGTDPTLPEDAPLPSGDDREEPA